MAYTQADFDSVKQAILDLATGGRVAEVMVDGQRVRYSETDMNQLKQLKAEIEAHLNQNRYRFVTLTQTSKGL
jgi:hypothetical protein